MDDLSFLAENNEGMVVFVKLAPNARASKFGEVTGGQIKIHINALPVDNQANLELIKFLSKSLKIPKTSFEIISGHSNKNKKILVKKIQKQELAKKFFVVLSS